MVNNIILPLIACTLSSFAVHPHRDSDNYYLASLNKCICPLGDLWNETRFLPFGASSFGLFLRARELWLRRLIQPLFRFRKLRCGCLFFAKTGKRKKQRALRDSPLWPSPIIGAKRRESNLFFNGALLLQISKGRQLRVRKVPKPPSCGRGHFPKLGF